MKQGKKILVSAIMSVAMFVLAVNGRCINKQPVNKIAHNIKSCKEEKGYLKCCNVAKEKITPEVFVSGVNGKNEPGYDAANEGELITVDTFFMSKDRVFLDDTVNNRILVYKNGCYEKKINLDFKRDVKKMYYDESTGVLKAVYENREKLDATHFYYIEIDVENNCIVSEQEISNGKKILLEYSFNSDGKLETNYYNRKNDSYDEEEVEGFVKELNDGDVMIQTGFASDDDRKVSVCSVEDEKTNTVTECILISEDGKVESYVVPDAHNETLTDANIQLVGGNIYQLKIDESKLEIVQLKPVEITNNCLDYYSRELSTEDDENGCVKLLNIPRNDVKAIQVSSWSTLTSKQITSRIDTCYNCEWSFAPKNRDTSVCNYPKFVKQSCFLDKYTNHSITYTATNIPYCWGGYTLSFNKQIADGYFASNVCTSSDGNNIGYISKTAGLDCSGFVSRVFKLGSHYGTRQLVELNCFTKRSEKANVKKNDVLIAPGVHTLIVQKVYTDDGKKYMDTVEESKSFGAIVKRTGRCFDDINKANGSGSVWPYKYKYIE